MNRKKSKSNRMRRAIAYVRPMPGRPSIIEQENAIAEFAKKHKYNVIAYYADDYIGLVTSSGRVMMTRAEIVNVTEYSLGLKWQSLLVVTKDALHHPEARVDFRLPIESYGKQVVSCDGYKSPPYTGELKKPQTTRSIIPYVIKHQLDERFSIPTFGYVRPDSNSGSNAYSVDLRLSFLIQRAYLYYAEGAHIKDVRRMLASQHPELFKNNQMVADLLICPIYKGVNYYYPAIVSAELWQKVYQRVNKCLYAKEQATPSAPLF